MSAREIDTAYIDQWASTLGLVKTWQALLERLRQRQDLLSADINARLK